MSASAEPSLVSALPTERKASDPPFRRFSFVPPGGAQGNPFDDKLSCHRRNLDAQAELYLRLGLLACPLVH